MKKHPCSFWSEKDVCYYGCSVLYRHRHRVRAVTVCNRLHTCCRQDLPGRTQSLLHWSYWTPSAIIPGMRQVADWAILLSSLSSLGLPQAAFPATSFLTHHQIIDLAFFFDVSQSASIRIGNGRLGRMGFLWLVHSFQCSLRTVKGYRDCSFWIVTTEHDQFYYWDEAFTPGSVPALEICMHSHTSLLTLF